MSRKKRNYKREILPDKIYNSKLITKLINNIMQDGKKTTAQKILYSAFELIEKKTNLKAMDVFDQAIKNVMPKLELKSRRLGGANYQVPYPVSTSRQLILAFRWIIQYARLRNEKTMVQKVANEIIDASKGVGGSIKRKENTHKMAEANKAFAHYRW